MANYPTLSRNPSYPIEEESENMIIKDSSEAGYETSRPRFTKRRKTWNLVYNALPIADKTSLDNFFIGDAAYGSAIFSWTNPADSASYNVRFSSPPKTSYVTSDLCNITFQLKEA